MSGWVEGTDIELRRQPFPGTANMNDHPLAIDMAELQVQILLETQPERVDRPEVGFVVRGARRVGASVTEKARTGNVDSGRETEDHFAAKRLTRT